MAAESRSASKPSQDTSLGAFDASLDHFARLGFERSWRIDRDALEDRYFQLSHRVHPDRHAGADAATRRRALEHSAALNEAYAVLRDPVCRAEYLVKLAGIDLDSSDPQTGAPHPEQSFLIDMIERRDRVAFSTPDDLELLHEEVYDELHTVFDRAIAALEAGEIPAAAAGLVHRRYLQRFLDELDARLDDDE